MKMAPSHKQFEGLEWEPTTFMLEPRWTIEPDLESLKRVLKTKLSSEEIDVTFLTQGAFNKIYVVRCDDRELIMRVSLPVDPRWKTLSEVATVEWVRDNTCLPIPRILAYDASRENPIGFEWILMSKIPGRCLVDAWRSMDFKSKERVLQQLAIFHSSLFRHQLRGIGNIYPVSESALPDVKDLENGGNLLDVGRVVSMHFCHGNHISLPVPRGPFKSTKDWMEAHLLCDELDSEATFATPNQKRDQKRGQQEDVSEDDEENLQKATRTLAVIKRLRPLIGDVFPPTEEIEPSMLWHNDLHGQNILVDEAGSLTGVVDWEFVSAVPLWNACTFPHLLNLRGFSLHVEPDEESLMRHGTGMVTMLIKICIGRTS